MRRLATRLTRLTRLTHLTLPTLLTLLTPLMLGARAVPAQIAKLELIAFESRTPSDRQFLTGARDAPPVTIAAELRIPTPGTARIPAIVILHGSGGITDREDLWAREAATLGVASLLIDSFTPRGIATTIGDQDQLSRLVMVLDAYRGLERLAQHPRIDPARVMVIGFSRGGGAAHWAALERFRTLHGPQSGLAFAGHIAFYPTCNRDFHDGRRTTGRPIRIFHGTADDYIPIAGCRTYVERLKAAGNDIAPVEYPGAHHGFDNAARKAPVRPAHAQTTRNCPPLEETDDGRIVNSRTRAPFSYAIDPCVERGTTLAFDAAAAESARQAVRELVRTVFGLK